MKLARYWTRQPGEAIGRDGSRVSVTSRGWSNDSIEDARARARDCARRLAERIASGETGRKRYLYGDRPLPEPVLREFEHGGDARIAVVTRNAYGALVLNTRDLMFVDIDREDAAPGVLAEVQRVSDRHGLAVRVYRTAAGYRALITNARFDSGDGRAEGLLREYGSDPLYVRLCKLQQSFRARLTPKPWRCGLGTPPVKFPYETPQEESRFRNWEAKYSSTAARYATCRYLTTFGGVRFDPAFEDVVYYHDEVTRATSDLPLA